MKKKFLIGLFALAYIMVSSLSLLACSEPRPQKSEQHLQFQRISGKDEYRVIGLGNVEELNIIIPKTHNNLPVTEIGIQAFSNDGRGAYIISVFIPESIRNIANDAFSGCSNLTEIKIPDSVTSIGNSAFSGCSSLTEIEIPDGLTGIGTSTFSGCRSLTNIEIPDSITSIDNFAFINCSSLTKIIIPKNVAIIGFDAFQYCNNLTIYCEAESQPESWHLDWNILSHGLSKTYIPTVWGYTGN